MYSSYRSSQNCPVNSAIVKKLLKMFTSAHSQMEVRTMKEIKESRPPWCNSTIIKSRNNTSLTLSETSQIVAHTNENTKTRHVFPLKDNRPRWTTSSKIEHPSLTSLKLDRSAELVVQTKANKSVKDVVSRPAWNTCSKIERPKITSLLLENTGESIALEKDRSANKNVPNHTKGNRPSWSNTIKIERPKSELVSTLNHEPIAPSKGKQTSRDDPQLPVKNFQLTFKNCIPAASREEEIQTAQQVPLPVKEESEITSPTPGLELESVAETQERCDSAVITQPAAKTFRITYKKPLPRQQHVPSSYTRLEIPREGSNSTSRKLISPSDCNMFAARLATCGLGLRKKATSGSVMPLNNESGLGRRRIDIDNRPCFNASIIRNVF